MQVTIDPVQSAISLGAQGGGGGAGLLIEPQPPSGYAPDDMNKKRK